MLIVAGYVLWFLAGFTIGRAYGRRVGRWLARWLLPHRMARHAARPMNGRHAASPPVDHESYAEPELTGSIRFVLANIVSWAESAAPEALENGRHLADLIRLDELTGDLAAAEVLLHVIGFSWHIAELADLSQAGVALIVSEAIGGAVYDLTELHRQTA